MTNSRTKKILNNQVVIMETLIYLLDPDRWGRQPWPGRREEIKDKLEQRITASLKEL